MHYSPPLSEAIEYGEKEQKKIEHISPVIEQLEETDDDEELNQKGFKNHSMGLFLIIYMAVISVFWIIILLVLCLDYYGQVSRENHMHAFILHKRLTPHLP